MISTKNLKMTPTERKEKVAKLREEHEDYFQTIGKINALYIPKMAYRPTGKDDLHISFFPSEIENECDIYTEFVSIDYDIEDPKRTLYKHFYNPHWKEEYELITSKSGYERHIIPVSELNIISDINTRKIKPSLDPAWPDPDEETNPSKDWLKRIALALEKITVTLENTDKIK